jgi:uncharacterized Fe-S cluster-containing protein
MLLLNINEYVLMSVAVCMVKHIENIVSNKNIQAVFMTFAAISYNFNVQKNIKFSFHCACLQDSEFL